MLPLHAHVLSATNADHLCDTLGRVLDQHISLLALPAQWQTTCPDLAHMMGAQLAGQSQAGLLAGQPARQSFVPAGSIVASTSGSTGKPRGALLTPYQLTCSAEATAEFFRAQYEQSPGAWLLCLPAHHIAGLQVVFRSLRAGYTPLVCHNLLQGKPFNDQDFSASTLLLRRRYPQACLYTSLVPTQLERLARTPCGVEALHYYAGVLVGGAGVRSELIGFLRSKGIRLVCTYGSSETAGGVVYNGLCLPGVHVTLSQWDQPGCLLPAESDTARHVNLPSVPARQTGRVCVTGPMVSPGYVNPGGEHDTSWEESSSTMGMHTFVSSDLGYISDRGLLHIRGRCDGVINSGGLKILPEDCEAALLDALPHLRQVCAAGVDHPDLGQCLVAAVVFADSPTVCGQYDCWEAAREITGSLHEYLRERVGKKYLIPRRIWSLPALPVIGPGKLDRQAIRLGLDRLNRG